MFLTTHPTATDDADVPIANPLFPRDPPLPIFSLRVECTGEEQMLQKCDKQDPPPPRQRRARSDERLSPAEEKKCPPLARVSCVGMCSK